MLLREFSQLAGMLVCDCMEANGLELLYTCTSSAGEMHTSMGAQQFGPVCGYIISRLALIQCVCLVAYLNQ